MIPPADLPEGAVSWRQSGLFPVEGEQGADLIDAEFFAGQQGFGVGGVNTPSPVACPIANVVEGVGIGSPVRSSPCDS
ncbi:MAG: hypothetical protein R3C12_23260 [Planctomycetaceae bacterium]